MAFEFSEPVESLAEIAIVNLEGGRFIHEIDKRYLVAHGEPSTGNFNEHPHDRPEYISQGIIVGNSKKFRILWVQQIEIKIIARKHVTDVLVIGQFSYIIGQRALVP